MSYLREQRTLPNPTAEDIVVILPAEKFRHFRHLPAIFERQRLVLVQQALEKISLGVPVEQPSINGVYQ